MERIKFLKFLGVIIGESEQDAISAIVEIQSCDLIKERHLLRIVDSAKHESVILWAVQILFKEEALFQSTFNDVFGSLRTLSIKAKAADIYLSRKTLTLRNVIYLLDTLKIEEIILKALNTFKNMNEKRTEDVLKVLKGIKVEAAGLKAINLLKDTPEVSLHDLYLIVITAETSSVRYGAARMMFESPMLDHYWLNRIKRCTLIEMPIRKQAKLIYWT